MNQNIRNAIAHWPKVAPVLAPARSRAEYDRLVAALDAVLDAGGADEKHPLAGLADRLGDLVAAYEARRPLKEMPVRQFLGELMKRHGLRQSQLPEIGAQSVVSAVLNGKRKLNARQIAALSKRFKSSADMFID